VPGAAGASPASAQPSWAVRVCGRGAGASGDGVGGWQRGFGRARAGAGAVGRAGGRTRAWGRAALEERMSLRRGPRHLATNEVRAERYCVAWVRCPGSSAGPRHRGVPGRAGEGCAAAAPEGSVPWPCHSSPGEAARASPRARSSEDGLAGSTLRHPRFGWAMLPQG